MKFHFESDLDYQHEAIEAVCDLFRGQEVCKTEFTVSRDFGRKGPLLPLEKDELGIGNKLSLLDDQIHANLVEIQTRNGLKPDDRLRSGDFTVEMETGTGKTYVYLRTILELNRRYQFNKYVIVVPSVAIKEGVVKSLEMTKDHFSGLYANTPYDFFPYDSSKLGQVRNFATSSNIQIMIATVGAINKKDVNNLYKDSEKTGGVKPIDLIRSTRPILIVDEPQSVDGGLEGRGKEALGLMSPLCTLRYSATHVDKHHMVYKLDAVDAYEKRLVKRIEVASAQIDWVYNKPFVKLISAQNQRGDIYAKVELDMLSGKSVTRKEAKVHDGDDLEQITKRSIYANCSIGEIRCGKGSESIVVRMPGVESVLRPGDAINDIGDDSMTRQMIRRTIKEHLDKELRLAPRGVKVLSLFFIDRVDNYRSYDDSGNPRKGKYGEIFEEEYRNLSRRPEYQSLFKEVDVQTEAEHVHDGYFSIDKKERWIDTAENNQVNRDSAERAYNLIMKSKEKLLSFETKLKFIFSHSALREGWDNPNIFQICSLRDMSSERERRQTIGRGLRLCVDQSGERIRGFDVNTLTVIANESYEEFAENLQKEIEKDTGIRFGLVESHYFQNIATFNEAGEATKFGMERSRAVWNHLVKSGYLDGKGKIQDSLKKALDDKNLTLPESYAHQAPQVMEVLRKYAGRYEIKNADERKTIKTREAILESEEFKALWDRIKHKTTYYVKFDSEALIQGCIKSIKEAPPIPQTRLVWRKADLLIGQSGVDAVRTEVSKPIWIDDEDIELPDILTDLEQKTNLTRRSLARILVESERLDDFKRNPQYFIETAAERINHAKIRAIVDGIKYERIGDDFYYCQRLFVDEELTGYLKNLVPATRSVYESNVCDLGGEKSFAEELERNHEAVKVYAKLPGWFKVPTPLGYYNPDWAVLVEIDGEERFYFVVETKPSDYLGDLRPRESDKAKCGAAHFEALGQNRDKPARFVVAKNFDDVLNHTISRKR
jgi:type III restriction enzyme